MKANRQHLERLRQGGARNWNMWRQSNPAIMPELQGTDLSGADLTGADLTGANVLGANVSGAILNYASLTETLINDEQLRSVKSRLEGR